MTTDNANKVIPWKYSVAVASLLIYLARNTRVFGEKLTDTKQVINHEWAIFIGTLMLKNWQISLRFPFLVCII